MGDKGKHYRYSYKGVKMDPYRICKLYNLGGGPREHATKKLLRGGDKGHNEREMWEEVLSCAERALEMLDEDVDTPVTID